MKIIFFLFLVWLAPSTAGNFVMERSVSVQNPVYMTTDHLGNSYVISNNRLLQYDSALNYSRSYSESNTGKLSYADVTNPLKILLFYSDFACVEFIDSKLSLQSKIFLRNIGILSPLLIATSSEEGFWVYDRQDFQLKRIGSNNSRVLYESGNISRQREYNLEPVFLTEYGNQVYLNNPATGILVFDLYGTYIKTIPLTGLSDFHLNDNELLYLKKGEYKAFHLKKLTERLLPLPRFDSSVISIRTEKHKLFLLTKEKLELYTLTINH